MTPFASVAMLEKFALLKIALCNAPAFSSAAFACLRRLSAPARADTDGLAVLTLRGFAGGTSGSIKAMPRWCF